MKTIARVASILVLVISVSGSAVKQSHRDMASDDANASTPERTATVQKASAAQIKQEAEELARLGSTVPADVERVNKGVLQKDLKEKLKRIESLSKKLRGEMGLN